MKVAILGSGPSGMMAAHAAAQCGYYVDIFDSSPDKSRRNSGVYLIHDDCDLLLDSVEIKQTVLGTVLLSPDEIAKAYGDKVYGKAISNTSVMEAVRQDFVTGYNAGQAIDRLWDLYGGQVQRHVIGGMEDVLRLFDSYDKIVSTIPVGILYPEYQCESVELWIKVGKAPEEEAFIFYNVNPHCDWYRCSAIFGVFVQEYGLGRQPNMSVPISMDALKHDFKKVTKVIGDGYTSTVDNLLLVGRYGAWRKETLTHHVYEDVLGWF